MDKAVTAGLAVQHGALSALPAGDRSELADHLRALLATLE